jgi:hypothetical protein
LARFALSVGELRVEATDDGGEGGAGIVVSMEAVSALRGEDHAVAFDARTIALSRGVWRATLTGVRASRGAERTWSLTIHDASIGTRDDADAGAHGAVPSGRTADRDGFERAADALGTLFVSGRRSVEGFLARAPLLEMGLEHMRFADIASLPGLAIEGTGLTFARDESGARVHAELTTAKTREPLVVDAALDAASLRITAAARGGPLELDGASDARMTLDGRASFDPVARTLDAKGALRVSGLRVQRRWLGAEPFAVDAGVEGRVTIDPSGAFRLDDGVFDFGASRALRGRVAMSGHLRELRIRVDAALLPVECNTALRSLPAPFRSVVGQLRFEGTKGIDLRLDADASVPDATRLDVRESGACTAISAPHDLAPQAFDAPFVMPVTGADGKSRLETFGPGTGSWRPLSRISRAFLAAVLTTEDASFFRHKGVAWFAIRAALADDLRARRFVRGGSTITMQLAKNLFLSRDKNLGRKLEEVLLTDYLEDAFGKERILELYANVVELGPDVFGIEAAARHYFGVGADELGVLEGMWLATLLPSPKERGRARPDGTVSDAKRRELAFLARKARDHGLLGDDDVADAEHGEITIPRRDGVAVRVPGLGLEAPKFLGRSPIIEGP